MDDFDRDSNVSSDNEHEHDDDITMHDVDAEEDNDNPDVDADEDEDNEPDNDNDNDENNDNEDEEDDDQDHHHEADGSQLQQQHQQQQHSQHGQPQPQQQQLQQQPTRPVSRKSTTPGDQPTPRWQPTVRPEVFTAKTYDIVPTMAAPMATSINAIAVTPDLRYWMTGGSDGYIRKYDGPATINGKTLLTVAQRHPFVDSVTKAGVLLSYWENAELPSSAVRQEDLVLSPVYSLAVHSQALWLLSGLESGGINLQSVRHDEGKRITCLQKHTNAVSALTLAADEKSVLSGSWDKNIFNWDLNTGLVARQFDGSGGQMSASQISAIELRPTSGAPFPPEAGEELLLSNTFSSSNGQPMATNVIDFKLEHQLGTGMNGEMNGVGVNGHTAPAGDMSQDVAGGQDSPAHDSLFGGSPGGGSDLFGDNDGMGAFGGDDDNEFSRAMMRDSAQDNLHMGDYNMPEATFNPENAPAPAVLPPPGSQQHGVDAPIDPTESHMSGPDGIHTNGVVSSTMPSTQEPVTSTAENSFSLDGQTLVQTDSLTGHEGEPPQSPSTVFAAAPATHHDTTQTSDSTFLSASIDGTIRIWDRRVPNPVARIGNRPGVPPWCMGACWSPDGNWIYAGRRNGTVEEFSVQKARAGWQPERILKFPGGSGPVSCLRPMPNGRHLVCASHDILRLYDLHSDNASKHAPPPFLIIPGPPRAGVISSLYIDASSRFMISAAGNRGWEGSSTEVLIGYEINVP
ncbi:WD40-repeat-containing domain protein [Xylaria telfairii]|nr:WD40-repeat-containing domain protein [Xylaria telfairii]